MRCYCGFCVSEKSYNLYIKCQSTLTEFTLFENLYGKKGIIVTHLIWDISIETMTMLEANYRRLIYSRLSHARSRKFDLGRYRIDMCVQCTHCVYVCKMANTTSGKYI